MEWFNPFYSPLGGSGSGGGGGGEPGRGIVSITFVRSSKGQTPGIAGATDTYRINYTDHTTSTYDIQNGNDGSPPLLREGSTAIEVSYNGGTSWSSLIPLADITGPAGQDITKIYYNTTDEWSKQTTLVSEYGALYVYSDFTVEDNKTIPNFKVGDGAAYVVDLPFITLRYDNHINNTSIHLSTEQSKKIEDSICVKINENDNEELVLYK